MSWSQFKLLKSNHKQWISRYILNKTLKSAELDLGKEFAEALEKNSASEKGASFEMVALQLPDYDKRELEIKTEFCGVPLLGRLDACDKSVSTIIEYKTGKDRKNAIREAQGQLFFYAFLRKQKFGKLPKRLLLHYIPTEVKDGKLDFVGAVEQPIDMGLPSLTDLLKLGAEIKQAWDLAKKLSSQYQDKIKSNKKNNYVI